MYETTTTGHKTVMTVSNPAMDVEFRRNVTLDSILSKFYVDIVNVPEGCFPVYFIVVGQK